MRKQFSVCEDFDFSHRVLRIGDIATMPEQLGIYRRHPQSLTYTRGQETFDRTVTVLQSFYDGLLGEDAAVAARLVVLHFMGATPVRDAETLEQLGSLLDRLVRTFLETHELTPQQKRRVVTHAAGLWWRVVQHSLQAGAVVSAARAYGAFSAQAEGRPSLSRLARSALGGIRPRRHFAAILRHMRLSDWPTRAREAAAEEAEMNGIRLRRAAIRHDNPPILYVVVDGIGANVAASRLLDEVQAILDKYGGRPVYLVNEAITDQPARCGSLQRVLERGAGAIGACLAADLAGDYLEDEQPRDLYKAHLQHLKELICQRFGVLPLFFGAAPDEVRSSVMKILRDLGFAVVFGTAGEAGSERRTGLRLPQPTPYWVEPGDILLMPTIGASSGSASARQILPIRSMIRRGYRTFALRCHGNPRAADGACEIRLLGDLCRFFFEEIGGLPGNPAGLVPPGKREQLFSNAPA